MFLLFPTMVRTRSLEIQNTQPTTTLKLEKVVGLTGFVIINVFIASFSSAQGERNQMVNAKFTRPVNAMPMSSADRREERLLKPLTAAAFYFLPSQLLSICDFSSLSLSLSLSLENNRIRARFRYQEQFHGGGERARLRLPPGANFN